MTCERSPRESKYSTDAELKRINQFDGEEAGFLCEILSSRPIASFAGVTRLGQKAADFLDQIGLRSAKTLVRRLVKIFLRGANIFVCLVDVGSLIIGRQFG